jgi:hypothetical protein
VPQALVHHEDHVEVLDLAKCSLLQNVNIDKAGCGHGRKTFPLYTFGCCELAQDKARCLDIRAVVIQNVGQKSGAQQRTGKVDFEI